MADKPVGLPPERRRLRPPGLGYVLGAPFLAGPRDGFGLPAGTIPLLAGALVGWTWNQGLAHRAYSWLSLGDRPAARRSLLLGAPVGALLGSLVALVAIGTASTGAIVFAAAQSCYLAAATALLVLGRERTLLAALSPMAAGAVLTMIRPVPDTWRLVLLLGSLAAVVILGLLEVAPDRIGPKGRGAVLGLRLPPRGRDQPRWSRSRLTTTAPRLAGSLPYALFGLGSGVLVLYAALGGAPAAVALTLSMGPAEWLLHRFRSNSLAGLRSTSTSKDFWRTAAVTLIECLSAYLATLLVLSLAVSALWPHAQGVGGVGLAGLLLLGVVLWTGLLLQSVGAVIGAAAVCCLAALAQTLALATHAGSPPWVGLTVYGTAAGVQAALVGGLLGRATAHR